jgi:hypothetical protein
MDNFHFDMTSQGAATLKTALSLFNPPGRKVTGYSTDGKRLVLYWTDSPKATKLPFPMTLEQAADFAAGWLEHADYGSEPDHDGDNGKGWRLYCEGWGHVDRDHCAFAAVQPVWAMYGK